VLQNHGDVALRDVVRGNGGDGWPTGLGVLVIFSNLNDSMILQSFCLLPHIQ